jgi:hypothetical protein
MWRDLAIAEITGFRSAVDDPRFRPDPVVFGWVAHDLRAFWSRSADFGMPEGYIRAITAHFVGCLRALDALPRDDPFWDGTNRRPTGHKMGSFAATRSRDRPAGVPALWMTAAVQMVATQPFWPPVWKQLREAQGVDALWPLYAALHGYDGGYDTVPEVAAVLKESWPSGSAGPSLDRLTASGVPWISEWAGQVRQRCGETD